MKSDGAAENEGRTRGLDVDSQSLIWGQSEVVQEEDAHITNLMVGFANESVHIEHPMEGINLGEARDIHWEASVGEYHSEHSCALCLLPFAKQGFMWFSDSEARSEFEK